MRKRRALWLLKAAVTFGFLASLTRVVERDEVLRLLHDVETKWLVAVWAVCCTQIIINGLRWHIFTRATGLKGSVFQATATTYACFAINQILPTSLAGETYRFQSVRPHLGGRSALQCILMDRVSSHFVWIAALGVAVPVMAVTPLGPDLPAVLVHPITLWATGLAIATLFVAARRWIERRGLGRFQQSLKVLFLSKTAAVQVFLTALVTAGVPVGLFLSAGALGHPLPPAETLVRMPLVLAALALPLSIGNWGLREGAVVAVLGSLAPVEILALSSLVYGAMTFLAAVPGLALLWLGRPRPLAASLHEAHAEPAQPARTGAP